MITIENNTIYSNGNKLIEVIDIESVKPIIDFLNFKEEHGWKGAEELFLVAYLKNITATVSPDE